MKKYLLFSVCVMCISLFFTSCSDKDDDKKDSYSLTNTVWEEEEDGIIKRFTFSSADRCTYHIISPDLNETYTNTYAYSIDYPTVYMEPDKEGNARLKGIITDNTMKIINISSQETIAFLVKKK